MPAILYARDGDISPKNSFNPSLSAKNKLNLLPEHIAEISTAFIHQLTLAPLTSRELRVLTAIYDQTIGYNKREDDMNGTRLEQLTGIRRDHANEAVRRLEALHIIITHQGHYGKWMSINFDFPNWGKDCPESKTNNPIGLVSSLYQNILHHESAEFQLHTTSETRKKEATMVIKEEQSVKPSLPILPVSNTTKPPLPAIVEPNLAVDSDVKATPFELDFPDSFPEKLRQLIIRHLAPLNLPQKAQRLLDYFAKCLNNGKIQNPIAYFISLKNRWLKGCLDLDDHQASPVDEEKKGQQQEEIKQRIAYQDAVADIEQLKKLIKIVTHQEHCTFDEALKKINYTQIWAKATACLEQTREAC